MSLERRALVPLMLIGFLAGAPAVATPTVYDITFAPDNNSNGGTPTGSFTYDPSAPAFTGFIVVYDGATYNLTSSANAPTPGETGNLPACVGGDTGAKASFDLLIGNCPGSVYAGSVGFSAFANFEFTAPVGSCSQHGDCITIAAQGVATHENGKNSSGTFQIMPDVPLVTTPEPAASALALAGLALCAVKGKKRLRCAAGRK